MGESDIGNINALREWTRRYFYTKEDINYFVTKLNEGLKGYALMFIGSHDKKVTISPNNYEFILNSDGWYKGLFFFNRNQEITIEIEDGEVTTYQLDEYNDTINLSPYVIATEQMTSAFQPSGYITESGHYHGGLVNAFNRNDEDYWDNWIQTDGTSNQWLCYEFPEPKTVYKVTIMLTPFHYANGVDNIMRPEHFAIQASNDGENWVNIYEVDRVIPSDENSVSFGISDPKPYIYYRYWAYTSTIEYATSWYNNVLTAVKEIYYYTIEQDTSAYQIATPIMSSGTFDGYEASASTIYSNSYPAWKAFNQVAGDGWAMNGNFNTHMDDTWIQMKFPQPKIIKKLRVWERGNVKTFIFQGSNDGINFINLGTFEIRHDERLYNQIYYINNNNSYIYYRLKISEARVNEQNLGLDRIDMYEVA